MLKPPTLGGNGDIRHEVTNLDLGSTPFGLATALAPPDRTWWHARNLRNLKSTIRIRFHSMGNQWLQNIIKHPMVWDCLGHMSPKSQNPLQLSGC